MTRANIKYILLLLDWVACIHYPIWFNNNKIKALIDLYNKVNTITLVYAAKLSLKACFTNIEA